MPQLQNQLALDRCPHCGTAAPTIPQYTNFQTNNFSENNLRVWGVYICQSCGGVITVATPYGHNEISEMYPESQILDESIPPRAKEYLRQAIDSIHASAGAIMLAASSVDAMLKSKGLSTGSLYSRINNAVQQNLITQEMANWAHEVRLDANDQRHSDEEAELPNTGDAKKVIEFAKALAQFLFVLPSRVERGLNMARDSETAGS